MAVHVIRDIRYFESSKLDQVSSMQNIGKIYPFPVNCHAIGQRIARKLHQYNFISGSFDHIYIYFCTHLKDDEIIVHDENIYFKWFRQTSIGLSQESIHPQDLLDMEGMLITKTFQVLDYLYPNPDSKNILEKVKNEIRQYGSAIEILYKTKETKHYKIIVSFQIKPNGSNLIVVWMEYHDKIRYVSMKKKILGLHHLDDLYYLVDSFVLKNDFIVFKPKNSYSATVNNQGRISPFKLSIVELLTEAPDDAEAFIRPVNE
jgi:hypothetical protein